MRRSIGPDNVIPAPALIPLNSVWCGVHRESGFIEFKDVLINPGAAGAQLYNLFTWSESVELKAIYGRFTDVTNVVTVNNCHWDIFDGVVNTALSGNVNCSGAVLSSKIVKDGLAVAAPTFLNADQARFLEIAAGPRPFQGALLNAKTGATNYIRFGVTTDINTNCQIRFVAIWACRYPGSLFAPV